MILLIIVWLLYIYLLPVHVNFNLYLHEREDLSSISLELNYFNLQGLQIISEKLYYYEFYSYLIKYYFVLKN